MKSASPLVYLGIGAAVATGALFLMSQATGDARDGRFQIVMRDGLRADTFLLDTHEGRVWQMTEFSFLDGKPTAWLFTERIDTSAELTEYLRREGK